MPRKKIADTNLSEPAANLLPAKEASSEPTTTLSSSATDLHNEDQTDLSAVLAVDEAILLSESSNNSSDTSPSEIAEDSSEEELIIDSPELQTFDTENGQESPTDDFNEPTSPSSLDNDSDTSDSFRTAQPSPDIFTIKAHTQIASQREQEDIVWHDLKNAMLTHRVLTGTLGGMERTGGQLTLAIVYYKETRIVIPLSEMMIYVHEDSENIKLRQQKILNRMLGAEIDFIVKGMDDETRSVVASRKDAMLKKRRLYYLRPDPASSLPRVHVGRLVQARVVGVGDKIIRVEAFGVETTITSRHLSWEWFSNASDRYHVGERIIVRIQEINGNTLEQITIKADVKSLTENKAKEHLNKCVLQATYIGKVTGVKNGITFIHLENGANAVAHSCFDPHNSRPGVHDDVAFVVTRIDYERGVAVGLIRRVTHRYL